MLLSLHCQKSVTTLLESLSTEFRILLQSCKYAIIITLPEISDYTIREFIYGVQDTTAVVRGTHIACEIIAVSNPGYILSMVVTMLTC